MTFSQNMIAAWTKYPSSIPLVIANVAPLCGVLWFDWSLFHVLFLYWLESAVVGIYNVFKLAIVSPVFSMLLVPFFIVHYGGFMAGHLVFLFGLFGPEYESSTMFPPLEVMWRLLNGVAVPIIGLFISHGISFVSNFILAQEYKRIDHDKQMMAPYRRIILMHITILFGGWLVMLTKTPVYGLVLLIVLKTAADMVAHVKEHDGLRPSSL